MSPALPPPPDCPTMQEHWCVSVMAEGDTLVTIGHNWLSGKGELTDEETQTVIGAASHLLSFVGYGLPQSDFDPDAEEIHSPAVAATPRPPKSTEGHTLAYDPQDWTEADGGNALARAASAVCQHWWHGEAGSSTVKLDELIGKMDAALKAATP